MIFYLFLKLNLFLNCLTFSDERVDLAAQNLFLVKRNSTLTWSYFDFFFSHKLASWSLDDSWHDCQ